MHFINSTYTLLLLSHAGNTDTVISNRWFSKECQIQLEIYYICDNLMDYTLNYLSKLKNVKCQSDIGIKHSRSLNIANNVWVYNANKSPQFCKSRKKGSSLVDRDFNQRMRTKGLKWSIEWVHLQAIVRRIPFVTPPETSNVTKHKFNRIYLQSNTLHFSLLYRFIRLLSPNNGAIKLSDCYRYLSKRQSMDQKRDKTSFYNVCVFKLYSTKQATFL